MTPEELIQAYYDGDDQAFERLEPQIRPIVLQRVRRNGVPLGDQEDVLMMVLMKVASTRGRPTQYRQERGRFWGWVGQVTRHTLADYRRGRARPLPLDVWDPAAQALPDEAPTPEELQVQVGILEDARDCLDHLESPYSDVLVRRLLGRTFELIGKDFGQKRNWAVEKERTAKRRLRNCMQVKGYRDAEWTS